MVVNESESSPGLSLDAWRETLKVQVDTALSSTLPPADTRPAVIHEAMRYACLNGGKRLRAIFTLAFCEATGAAHEKALRPAIALEAFHASTLVHDDLPCMDDDDTRRGMPSTHVKFGEANALLAGNALLTLALQWMAETAVPPPHPPGILVTELARAGGSQGVIAGQVEDLAAEGTVPSEDELLFIHTEKTARLIACACRVGVLCAGGCSSRVDQAGEFGLHLGMAFQIQDDILDVTQSTSALGKPAGSDENKGKLTAVSCWGLEESRKRAAHYTRGALDRLAELDLEQSRIAELAESLLNRTS
jgi:geranylgeranyl diphosphate synthase type II